jgi:hypothetical protein
MKTNLNYQVLLSKVAKNQYKLHNQKQEWKAFVFFIFLIKVLTWAVSVFAGWHFAYIIVYKASNNHIFSVIIATLSLVLLEGATNLALSKLFKFSYRGTNHISTSVAMVFVVLMLFGTSFYISTTGLSMRQAKKADNSPEIIEKYKLKADELKKEYQSGIADLDAQIISIRNNPQGWSHGQRNILLTWQLNKIDSLLFAKSALKQTYKNDLKDINNQKQFQLSQNSALMTTEADKYYNIVTVIMIIQFITSGMLMYFFKIIHAEDNPDDQVNEEISELNEIITTNTFNAMKSRMNDLSNAFALAMINQMPEQKNLPFKDIDIEEERVQISGFKTEKKPDTTGQKTGHETAEPSRRFAGRNKNTMQAKYVEYLNKHKLIVRSIKLLKIPEKNSLANAEIQKIQQLAAGAAHKSRTLVREVYRVAVTVGLNRIDNNGNINL